MGERTVSLKPGRPWAAVILFAALTAMDCGKSGDISGGTGPKLDVDTNIKTATRFNVRSIPLLLFFKDGKVVDQIVGAVPRTHIENKLQQHAA